MIKTVTSAILPLAAVLLLAGASSSASAHNRRGPGCNCGPTRTTHYKIIHPAKFYTHYHDVSVTRHVQRVHRIVTVTQVQPIIHIHDVTRVHHHTVVDTRNAYEHLTRHLEPIRYVQRSVENFYDCRCGR